MLEKQIEHELMKEVKARGGLCIKLVSPSMSGLPDRMVLMHGGNIGFVELKQRGKKPRSLQVRRMEQIGCNMYLMSISPLQQSLS